MEVDGDTASFEAYQKACADTEELASYLLFDMDSDSASSVSVSPATLMKEGTPEIRVSAHNKSAYVPASCEIGREFNMKMVAEESIAMDPKSLFQHAYDTYKTQPMSLLQVKRKIAEQELMQRSRAYNTTGTFVTSDHSVSNPDIDQIMYCVAAVLQAEVASTSASVVNAAYPEFYLETFTSDVVPVVPTDEQDVNGDPLHYYATFEYMFKFIQYLYHRSFCHPECLIVALIYVNRITSNSDIKLNPTNWRNIWVTCVIVAQKMWDDHSYATVAYTAILTGLNKNVLRTMERNTLNIIKFDIGIKASLYAKFYFELRHMYREFCPGKTDFDIKSLVGVVAQQLEERSHNRSFVKRKKASSSSKTGSSKKGSGRTSKDATDKRKKTKFRH